MAKYPVEPTQRSFGTTQNTVNGETVSAYLLRAYPSAIVANVHEVAILNSSNTTASINMGCVSPLSLPKGASVSYGGDGMEITNISSHTFIGVVSMTILWSEINA